MIMPEGTYPSSHYAPASLDLDGLLALWLRCESPEDVGAFLTAHGEQLHSTEALELLRRWITNAPAELKPRWRLYLALISGKNIPPQSWASTTFP